MTNQQIITLYEVDGADPSDIAESFGLTVDEVKMVLIGGSTKFRAEAREDKELFTDDDMAQAGQRIRSLMYSEIDAVAFRAACRVIDEKKGRLTNAQKLNGFNVNINLFNEHNLRAKEAIKKAKTIDVTPKELAA